MNTVDTMFAMFSILAMFMGYSVGILFAVDKLMIAPLREQLRDIQKELHDMRKEKK